MMKIMKCIKKLYKRGFAFFLAATMCAGMTQITVFAAESEEVSQIAVVEEPLETDSDMVLEIDLSGSEDLRDSDTVQTEDAEGENSGENQEAESEVPEGVQTGDFNDMKSEESKEQEPEESEGEEPETSEGQEPGISEGTEAEPSEGTEPKTPEGEEPGTLEGMEAEVPEGTEPGTPEGSESGTSEGQKPEASQEQEPEMPKDEESEDLEGAKPEEEKDSLKPGEVEVDKSLEEMATPPEGYVKNEDGSYSKVESTEPEEIIASNGLKHMIETSTNYEWEKKPVSDESGRITGYITTVYSTSPSNSANLAACSASS